MTRFRRLVLELGHGAADPATLRMAATFARSLDAELHALFVEDETLLHASGLPFAREINTLSLSWRKMAPSQLESDLRAEADQARRHLMEAARATGVAHHFEVYRGDLSLRVNEICVASDIVVVSAPPRTGAAIGREFRVLRDSACASAASVLFLPRRAARRHGPVVAVLSGTDDPSLAVARSIAEHGKQRLEVLTVGNDPSPSDPSPGTVRGTSVQDLTAALGDKREGLIVITRDDTVQGEELAAARGVPVLVIEPP